MAARIPGRTSGRSPARRRQRSVRVTVAVTLMAAATVVVLLALPTRSATWMSAASVLALVLAWAALRMMWTEVLQSRRENAADRAATASAYQDLFSRRAAEHAEFTSAMTEQLAQSRTTMRELEGAVVQQQRRAVTAESRLVDSNRRLDEARAQVNQLEGELTERQAELADALASWESEGGVNADLADFERRAQGSLPGGRHSGANVEPRTA